MPGDPARERAALDRHFRRAARLYDLQVPLERRGLTAAARLAAPVEGLRMIDVATGTGALAAAILARGGTPERLIAIDRSPEMLERARRRLAPRLPRGRLELVRGDVAALPVPDAAFDVASMGFLVHLLPDAEARRALTEVRRVLRPGGRLVVVVHSHPAGRAGALYRAVGTAMGRLAPGLVVGGGPIRDCRPLVVAAGLTLLRARHVAGPYWTQVVLAARPASAG